MFGGGVCVFGWSGVRRGELHRVGEKLFKLYQKTQCIQNSIAKYNAVESNALKLR